MLTELLALTMPIFADVRSGSCLRITPCLPTMARFPYRRRKYRQAQPSTVDTSGGGSGSGAGGLGSSIPSAARATRIWVNESRCLITPTIVPDGMVTFCSELIYKVAPPKGIWASRPSMNIAVLKTQPSIYGPAGSCQPNNGNRKGVGSMILLGQSSNFVPVFFRVRCRWAPKLFPVLSANPRTVPASTSCPVVTKAFSR